MPTQIVHGLSAIPSGPHVVTIGNFDGVHRGHQYLLKQVVDRAIDGARSLALTFDPLPAEVLRPDRAPKRLTTTEDRLALMAETGLDVIAVVPFTREFAALEAREFVERLVDAAQPVHFVVGADFRFGHDRTGSADLLRELGPEYGFTVTVVERIGGEEISSTRIRQLLAEGDVRAAADLLGRWHTLSGRVETGAGRGRNLGFPTANLAIPPALAIPADGIYAAHAALERDGEWLPALVYIGTRPTFSEAGRVVEVFLLDFTGDLYGSEVTVRFLERIRGDMTFESPEALTEQMHADEAAARRIFAEFENMSNPSGAHASRTSGREAERGHG